MLPFQWSALRLGDRVMVHDDLDPSFQLRAGIVARVRTRQPGVDEIAIRLDEPASAIVWPRRHSVHLLPIDQDVACWRCDMFAAGPTGVDRRTAA
jgi:hypothetical protein